MSNKIRAILAILLGLMPCLMQGAGTPGAEMRRPVSTEHPLYLFHIDVWNNADPQKIIDLVPDDIRPYTVFNVSLSVTESVTKDGMRTSESWVRTCAENRVWCMIQPASGGHAWFSDYDFSVYRYFFETYPNFLGFNYCEQFWGFNDSDGLHPFGDRSPSVADRMNLFANLLEIADEYGGYLVVSNCLVIPEWDATSPLTMFKRYPDFASAAKKYKDHLIYLEKYTMSANYYDMESQCFGVFMSDYCDNWGMRFDECGYNGHVYKKISDAKKMPPAIAGMTIMEHMMMTGQTVQDGPETIPNQIVIYDGDQRLDDGYMTRRWSLYPQVENVYFDVWRKFTTDGVVRILPRQEVMDSTKIAVYNDIDPNKSVNDWEGRRAYRYLFSGLYAADDGVFGTDSMFLKRTGRYTTIPTIFIENGKEEGFMRVVKQSRINSVWRNTEAKVTDFNTLFAPQTSDNEETSLYVRHIDNNWMIYNRSQYEPQARIQSSNIRLRYNSCDSVGLTMPFCSFGLMTEKAEGIDFYLNNYTHLKSRTTDEIVIYGCSSEPTWELRERGDHTASAVESSFSGGTLTLIVTHNGPLDISVKCRGNATDRLAVPEWTRTSGTEIPPVYTGVRQYECENADYLNIDRGWNTSGKSDVPGFTALGYVSLGKERSAKIRDVVRIDQPGTYRMDIRYLSPDGEVKNINVSVNGTVKARNISFTQTDSADTWSTTGFEVILEGGESEILISTTRAQQNALYLDSFTLTPVNVAGSVESVGAACRQEEDGVCHDLFGRKVNSDRLPKGQIYVQNGRKKVKRQ